MERFFVGLQRRLFLLAALSALAPALALAAGGDPEARALLDGIYKIYSDAAAQEAAGVSEINEDQKNAKHYTPELVALLARDRKESSERGEIGRLDFDPFIYAQEWEATAVAITVEDAGAGRAHGVVSFKLFNKETTVRHDLVRTPGGWRIADIHWNDEKEGLKDILSKPLQ